MSCLRDLFGPVAGTRRRSSSWDRSGGNDDFVVLPPGGKHPLLDVAGVSGTVQRIWVTMRTEAPDYLRTVKLSAAFDDEPTVDGVPWGMFSGSGPWRVNDLVTPVASIMRSRPGNRDSGGAGLGAFNLRWPMPFCRNARLEILNSGASDLMLFFHVDYVEERHETEPLLFHAFHRAEFPTRPAAGSGKIPAGDAREPKNLTNANNYLFADIQRCQGRYVGTILAVESHPDRAGKWYEGDDMFVIDGEPWPPRLHGTGTEDYFGMAWGVHRPWQAGDCGVSHYERSITGRDRPFDGRFTLYRFHLDDPILFARSLHASIEAGHANECAQNYESMALWYARRS